MGISFYNSKDKCDWRLTIFSSKSFSWLEIVGNRRIKGTILNRKMGFPKCSQTKATKENK